ncbi:MAG: fatty acid desaturase [Marinobacter sp.]
MGIGAGRNYHADRACVHYTVFRTRKLNNIVGQICGLIIMLPHRFFRYEHCRHHTYTQLAGQDPELIPQPKTYGEYLHYLSSIPYSRFPTMLCHACTKRYATIFMWSRVAISARIWTSCVRFTRRGHDR